MRVEVAVIAAAKQASGGQVPHAEGIRLGTGRGDDALAGGEEAREEVALRTGQGVRRLAPSGVEDREIAVTVGSRPRRWISPVEGRQSTTPLVGPAAATYWPSGDRTACEPQPGSWATKRRLVKL